MKLSECDILVSLFVIAYNQEEFVRDAVEGALQQNYRNLEIILSDDCSTDSTYEIMKEVASNYAGSHKVVLNRNSKNLGLVGHFNYVMSMSNGDIVVPAAGDDVSMPTRVQKLVSLFDGGVSAVSSESVVFSECVDMARVDASETVPVEINRYDLSSYEGNPKFHLNGATRAYRADIFKTFGELNADCPTEDSVSLLRSLILGDVVTSSEKLVLYRWHGKNLSSEAGIARMNFENVYKQYIKDLDLALNSQWVDDVQYSIISGILKERCLKMNQKKVKNSKGTRSISRWLKSIKNIFLIYV